MQLLNPTKNVRYIEIENDIFEQLCECEYDKKVRMIQKNYQVLCQTISGHIEKWMKIKDKDCYFNSAAKILFPDTRKMVETDLRLHVSDSYDGTVRYLNSCSKDTKEALLKQAEEAGLELPSEFEKEICGFDAQPISSKIIHQLFDDNSCPCLNTTGRLEVRNGEATCIIADYSSDSTYSLFTRSWYHCKSVDKALKISVHRFNASLSLVEIIVSNKLIAETFDESLIEQINAYSEIVQTGIDVNDFVALKSYLKDGSKKSVGKVDLRREAIENDVEAEEIDLQAEDGLGAYLKQYFDNCDYMRARIQRYNSKWYLSDEGKGHWELWGDPDKISVKKKSTKKKDEAETESEQIRKHVLKLAEGVIARNPLADVKHDAVVGIDFGTKSTIVALQDGDDQIIPLRVGMADYSVAPEAIHYENPTVMQFVDLMRFMEKYALRTGRPMTSWDDLLISHEAFNNLISAEKSIDIAAFTTDLKQWAGGKGKNKNGGHLIIKDSKGYRYDIDNYMSLASEDIDLIEIYAYYIGLFINNMHTGIHLDYILSFPETFSKEIKEHILNSFTNGIKKSIPPVVLADPECNEAFRVRQGPSEPAAYAACALEQYGIEPTDDGVFYGIFDFGGGTTDYDYGVWKNAPEDEYTYNYVIKHYGAGGDKTLGGENILELLAYYIFCDDSSVNGEESNLEKMRKNKLVFYRPEEGKVFSGTEALNNDSESALLNTKLMMEVLRPIWEEWKVVKEWFGNAKKQTKLELNGLIKNASVIFGADSSVKAKLALFSDSDRVEVCLNINMSLVNSIINDRIESGVRNFFEGLTQAYNKFENHKSKKIHIFLAGNSSKSKRVLKLFKDYVVGYNSVIFEEQIIDKDESNDFDEKNAKELSQFVIDDNTEADQNIDELKELNELQNSHFIVYPPLGTEDARRIQKERNIAIEENSLMAPTGKTGVAFGLVMCREGSMIKVESETKKNAQIKLNYYIGLNYRKNFKLIFDRNSEYQKWLKFSKITAETGTFEFYYSELPEVVNGNIAIKDNKSIYKRKCLVDNVSEDASIYFRFISPTQLEYVVATDDKVDSGEFISKVYRVDL